MPYRLREYKRALAAYGVDVGTFGGRHSWKACRGNVRYPFGAHRGLQSEIDDVYIRSLCDRFGIDEEEFRRRLLRGR